MADVSVIVQCRVRQLADVIDGRMIDQWRSSPSFWMEFSLSDATCSLHLRQRRAELCLGRSDLLEFPPSAFGRLSPLFASLGIPTCFHDSLLQGIRNYAHLFVNDSYNAHRRVIPMAVDINLSVEHVEAQEEDEELDYEEDEDIIILDELLNPSLDDGMNQQEDEEFEDEDSIIMDEILNSSLEDVIDHLGVRPASKASIEAMKKLKFDGGTHFANNTDCMICLEEFNTGAEVNQMPCLHSFHRDCIVEWLQRNHVCPLCRYEMPHSMSS